MVLDFHLIFLLVHLEELRNRMLLISCPFRVKHEADGAVFQAGFALHGRTCYRGQAYRLR